jgi:hypothetical protein
VKVDISIQVAQNMAGRNTFAVGSFFQALRQLHFILVGNTGLDPLDLIACLRVTSIYCMQEFMGLGTHTDCLCAGEREHDHASSHCIELSF